MFLLWNKAKIRKEKQQQKYTQYLFAWKDEMRIKNENENHNIQNKFFFKKKTNLNKTLYYEIKLENKHHSNAKTGFFLFIKFLKRPVDWFAVVCP